MHQASKLKITNPKELEKTVILQENPSPQSNERFKLIPDSIKALVLNRNTNGNFSCPFCNKTFKSKSATFRHCRNHTGDHPYVCSVCQKCFASKASVDSHQLRIHNLNRESALTCSECGKLFIRRSALEVHLKIHSMDKPFSCQYCGKSFTQKISRDIHLTKHTGKLNFECSVCSKLFATQAKLNAHSTVHLTPQFTCEICGRMFVRQDTLTVHSHTHSGERPFHCDVCPRTFLSKSRLLKHSQFHGGDGLHHCSVCSCQFKQKLFLMAHLQIKHNLNESDLYSLKPSTEEHALSAAIPLSTDDGLFIPSLDSVPPAETSGSAQLSLGVNSILSDPEKVVHRLPQTAVQSTKSQFHTCHLCSKRFIQKSKLTAHIRTHFQEPLFQCDICGKRFHRKDVYNNHKNVHIDEKPFSCAHCGKTFSSKFNLSVHLKTHSTFGPKLSTIKDFQCNDCGKKFKHKKSLMLHRKIHTGDLAHTCATCGKKFAKKSHFESHLRSHLSDRPFQCQTCGRCFKESKHYREHVRKTHPNTFSLASLFESISGEDAQIEQMSNILCSSTTSVSEMQEDSSHLNVSSLSDSLQPVAEVSNSTVSVTMDRDYLLPSDVNLNETAMTISTSIPNLVFTNLDPMLQDIEIPNASQYLINASQESVHKNDVLEVGIPECSMALTMLSEDTCPVLSQGLQTSRFKM